MLDHYNHALQTEQFQSANIFQMSVLHMSSCAESHKLSPHVPHKKSAVKKCMYCHSGISLLSHASIEILRFVMLQLQSIVGKAWGKKHVGSFCSAALHCGWSVAKAPREGVAEACSVGFGKWPVKDALSVIQSTNNPPIPACYMLFLKKESTHTCQAPRHVGRHFSALLVAQDLRPPQPLSCPCGLGIF